MNDFSMEKFGTDVLGRIDRGDLVVSCSEAVPVEFENDRLKSIENLSRFSAGLRVFENGRAGNGMVNSPAETDFLISSSRESAVLGDPLEIELPGPSEYADLDLDRKVVQDYTKEEAVALGHGLMKELKSIDGRAQASVSVYRSSAKQYLWNTSGFRGTFSESRLSVSGGLQLVEEDGSLLFIGDGDSRHDGVPDTAPMLEKIEWRYKNSRKNVSVKSGYYPVIFAPEALDLLLESYEIAANGKTLYKGISVFSDKIGCEVASPSLTLRDEPFHPEGGGSYPFDDEGVIPSSRAIIEKGRFQGFIFDLASGKRTGNTTTGHGQRSTSSMPSPGFSNLVIEAGDQSFEEMVGGIDYGLYVISFLGGGMSNVLAGDFSVNVELGFLIKNGKVVGRVKDAMLSGNAFAALSSIGALENKLERNGSFFAPHILINSLSVSG